jgi:octaprenyl-diphosphate synthase
MWKPRWHSGLCPSGRRDRLPYLPGKNRSQVKQVILTDLTAPIQGDLDRVEKTIADTLRTENLFIQQMVDYLSSSAGKRVRPALAILSAKYGGGVTEETICLGAALEMIHVATLIHDDIIDNSETRRKQKSLNFKWGNEVSVLMGDYVFATSFYLMAKKLPKDVLGTLADTTNIICRGEISETFQRFNADLTETQYLEVIREKTASLFAASCRTGAMLAKAEESAVRALHDFGLGVGMAFQVVDDTLDYVGKESRVGKPVMSDLREGKLTLPVLHCLASASKAEKEKLKAVILAKLKSDGDLEFVNSLIEKYGAIEASVRRARDFVRDAKGALASLKPNGLKEELLQFADFLIDRDF